MFIGLNPSTADEVDDDPTVRRCIAYARAWGFDALCMTNLFGLRATLPAVMRAHAAPVGPENDARLADCARRAALIVACWGNHGRHLDRDAAVLRLLRRHRLHCLKLTSAGTPNHPLYLRGDLRPRPFASPSGGGCRVLAAGEGASPRRPRYG